MPAVGPAPVDMQRRHSSASSDTGSDPHPSTHTSQENVSVIPTRTTKVATSKPVANPLQFVKVGPCDLSRFAQEQLKKVEEVKKVKPEKRDEAEDWQSNLDIWKFSRRKRQEHIIERVVEVKKLELEEHDRNRRRSKTFSEMLEERNSKGRKASLPVYQDDNNDLSDLGLSTAKLNGDDSVFHDTKDSSSNKEDDSSSCNSGVNGDTRTAVVNGHMEECSHERSPDQEEYTYERAIQNYVNFTESRVRGKSHTDIETSKITNGPYRKASPPVPAKPRRGSCKIEEKLSELEQIKQRSISTTDLTENTKKPLSVPKVDILKRREMFEKSQGEETPSSKNRVSDDFSSSKSIRDRLTSLARPADESQSSKKLNRLSSEISVKDRLLHIEKQNSLEANTNKSNTTPNETFATSSTSSVKNRLSTLQKVSTMESRQSNFPGKLNNESAEPLMRDHQKNSSLTDVVTVETKNNQSNIKSLPLSRNEEVCIDNTEKTIEKVDFEDKTTINPDTDIYDSKRQQHYRHRSLDSLDVDSTDDVGNEAFERVQSLEDLDFCRNYPASSVSCDTDREDSGIHTADVSSSVSQADDFESEYQQQPTVLDEIKKSAQLTSALIAKQIIQMNVSDPEVETTPEVVFERELVKEHSSGVLKLPIRADCDPLPVILESPSEPVPPSIIPDPPKPCDSSTEPSPTSHTKFPSHPDVTNNMSSDSVNTNIQVEVEQCNVIVVNGGESAANSILVNTTPLPSATLPAQVVHDTRTGDVEICQKVDVTALGPCLPSPPQVTVTTEYQLDPQQKFEDSLEYKMEGGRRPVVPPVFPVFCETNSTELIEAVFPLSPSTLEPPKEKPPPPPAEISDDDDSTTGSHNKSSVSLRRLDSTKRIKKEIRQKRSSFLGIEGSNDDNYLEPELELVRRPPDMTSLLAEEKRLEQMLYRQSICSESESRDSGVELEKHHDDLTWPTLHHSRDNSETYANTSTTSEEEEIMKKEREIIELLEREEIDRYTFSGQDRENIGEKLAAKLRELEAEKSRLEWEREAEEAARAEHQSRIQARERELCKQEELLMAERAVLARQREAMLHAQYSQNRSLTDVRGSLQDLHVPEPACYRQSMPNLAVTQPRRPPPPIPPAKSLVIPRSHEKTSQQMSRQTLQALSAAPRPRLNDNWLQSKRKPKDNCNYQHWLIQEAEQRRITEHHQRQALPPRRPVPPPWQPTRTDKPLPDAIIQSLTQRVQNRLHAPDPNNNRRRIDQSPPLESRPQLTSEGQEKMLSVSGKKKCSHCSEELGRGAAMIIESLRLFYHMDCFKCCVCCVQLGDGLMGTDVRVRNNKLHCHNCYSSDDGVKFSCV